MSPPRTPSIADCAAHTEHLDALDSDVHRIRDELALLRTGLGGELVRIHERLDVILTGQTTTADRMGRIEGRLERTPGTSPPSSGRAPHPALVAGGAIGVLLAVAELLRAAGVVQIALGGP